MAVPLLSDGCANTEAEMDEVLAMLYLRGEGGVSQTRTYLPLLREAVSFFEQDHLTALLAPHVAPDAWGAFDVPMLCTEAIGADWVKEGGKRLRPFVTSACYAVGKYGVDALAPDADLDVMVPQSVRRLSLSIEVMHKASLIHDDIMDDDAYRYGRETMHRVHGIGPAINLGDFLVGLGYKLIVGETGKLDAACIADIINAITTAHLALCRGQGAELSWTGRAETCSAVDALGMYALKTAPAFEVALYAGLRAANAFVDPGVLQRYSMYVGEGFQVLNDLEDWHSDEGNKVMRGQDALAGRPTILRAFTHEAGGADAIAAIMVSDEPADTRVGRMKAVYEQFGAFDKADKLLGRLRDRALTTASDIDPTPLRELFEFFVRMVLPARSGSKG
jgi:geranylgeranyl pyrophosphate synthase